MGTSNKVLLQDKNGNKYYPHTMADVVHVDETKTIGDWVSAKETQLTQAQTNATTQANYAKTQGDYAKVQGSQIETIATTIQDKVKINDTSTNVNFIRNEIVQDGLIYDGKNTNTTKTIDNVTDFVIQAKVKFGVNTSTTTLGVMTYSNDEYKFLLGRGINNLKTLTLTCYKLDGSTKISGAMSTKVFEDDILYDLKISVKNKTTLDVFVNDELVSFTGTSEFATSSLTLPNKLGIATRGIAQGFNGIFSSIIVYNRSLTPQEIQHNFNVLSNSQSINKINDYVIASDTDHITDSGSILQSKINRVFYKQNCKEFTSNGEAITVNNGMDGYLLSATLQGQTLKNYVSSTSDYLRRAGSAAQVEGDYIICSLGKETNYQTKEYTLESGKTYTAIFFNAANTIYNGSVFIRKNDTALHELSFNAPILTKSFVAEANVSYKLSVYSYNPTTEQKIAMMIIEGNYNEITAPKLFYGLSSTRAVISNNNMKYSFYSSLEDKLAGKVIDLGGLEGARNTFEIKEDGSAIWTQNTKEVVLNGSVDTSTNWALTNTMCFLLEINDKAIGKENLISDTFKLVNTDPSSTDLEFIVGGASNKYIYIRILKTKLSTQDVTGFKAWLQANPITVRYKLSTPIITTIPKELVPTILTQLQNTFTFSDAVAPSKVTIQAPVNRIAELQTQLDEIKALIQTPSNMNLTMNYIEDEYNKNQEVEGVM